MYIDQSKVPADTFKNELLNLLVVLSFQHSEDPKFKLAYREELSTYYINAKRTTLSSRGMVLIGQLIYEMIADDDVSGIGGLTFGADPIAMSAAMVCNLRQKGIEVFSVKKQPKTHGIEGWIEGNVEKLDKVIIVDDVITTGTSTMRAIEKVKQAGIEVTRVIVLVDRQEENGKENIENCGVKVDAIFTADDLKRIYFEGRHNPSYTRRAVSG